MKKRIKKGARHFVWSTLFLIFDVCILFLIFKSAWFLRAEVFPCWFPDIFHDNRPLIFINEYYWIISYWIIMFFYENLYSEPVTFWEETRRLLNANIVATILAILLIGLARVWLISRSMIFLMWGLGIFILPISRYLFKRILFSLGLFKRQVVLYGAGLTGRSVMKGLSKHPELGIDIKGFIDDDVKKVGSIAGTYHDREIRVFAEAEKYLNEYKPEGIDEIIITISDITRERLIKIMEKCNEVVGRVAFVPDIFGSAIYTASFECIDTALIMKFEQNLNKLFPRFIKRTFDIIISGILIILLSPVWLVMFFAIRFTSKGEVIFKQRRIAKGGDFFFVWKYRSMYPDSGSMLEEYLDKNPEAKIEWEQYKKLKGFDPRVTPVGRIIRKWSIDELPQLFNVFKGEMSLVGPRPYLENELEDMGDYTDILFKARPGITGFWQVSGRNNLSFNDRVRLDAFYIKNWSLWLDISMVFKTIPVILRREGAF
jgi:Undecaprenyl-phosphate galactose phosphotransferase WbaP